MSADAAAHVEVEYAARVDSTNLVARRRLEGGRSKPLWIRAEAQTQGRGRKDRAWTSPAGNLYASLLWFHSAPAQLVPGLSLVAGLAVRDAFAEIAAGCRLELKWPNDVLANGRKISGVLVEGVGVGSGGQAAIIGCGLNIAHYPDGGTRWPATSLLREGVSIGLDEMFNRLAATMHVRLAQWRDGQGVGAVARAWLAHAYGLGHTVTVNDMSGVFEGISAEGALCVRHADGSTQVHHAGDVDWAGNG